MFTKKNYHVPKGKTYNLFSDALKQHHLLIAGASGSGKSVLMSGLISTLLYRFPGDKPGHAQLILIDPKGREFRPFSALPHTLRYAVTQDEVFSALQFTCSLTDRRNASIQDVWQKSYSGSDVYIFIDDWADIVSTQGKRCKPLVQQIGRLGRSERVHLILSSHSPLREIIDTKIKVNFDAVFGLHCHRAQDSRNIIGESFLCDLPRYGQDFYATPEQRNLYRIPYVTEEEQRRLVDWWMMQKDGRSNRWWNRHLSNESN